MIEYDSFIYLDVYRTGSTHVIALLGKIADEKRVRKLRHSSLTRGRPLGLDGGKLVFTTVRNPWDWYVSLWAHGAGGKSTIRKFLSLHLDADELAHLYDRNDPATSFRRWLQLMHNPQFLERVMKEYLPQSGLAPIIGLYSYRFLRVTTRFPRLLLRNVFVRNPQSAEAHLRRFGAYDIVLHTETLSTDLITFVERNRGRCRFKPDAAEIIRKADETPANASRRSLGSYRDYYDEEGAALVANRDRLFSDVFGYRY